MRYRRRTYLCRQPAHRGQNISLTGRKIIYHYRYKTLMDKNITQNNQTKTQLSLAALMFFSPLVQNILNKSNFQLSTDDKTFIQ